MDYEQTVEYLYNSTPVFEKIGVGAYKEGLYNTHALDEHLCHPHRHYTTIHVAGTNGKGSVSHTMAAILQAAGYRVGLYTSPHLVDFRERIRVNGKMASKEYVTDFVERHRAFFEPLHPSFFELTTAMAFQYFAEQEVDIAVVEVGLGGRLDCTNIISPILSIITNISLDHTQLLGSTLAQIATEKAGIIKHGTNTLIGEHNEETRQVFEERAKEMSSPIIFAEDQPEVISATPNAKGGMDYITRHYGMIHGELGGNYQAKNTNTILNAIPLLRQSGMKISDNDVITGMANVSESTGLMGRWQKIGDCPKVICDTGHNVGGWQYLAPQITSQPCRQLRIVFGMVDDKDIDTVMDMLPKNAEYYFTRASSKRAIPEEKVSATGEVKGLHGKTYPTVKEAYEAAIDDSSPDDFIFVGGSSYLVADLLANIKEQST